MLDLQFEKAATSSMAKEPKLEYSDFSGEFEDDGVTVLVDIHRAAGSEGGWTLEVISQEEDVTTWEGTFETDKEAWEEFLATTEKDGIRSFLGGEESESVH
nr:hypothetical protein REQ54_02199 [Rhizobium sp. Q54]